MIPALPLPASIDTREEKAMLRRSTDDEGNRAHRGPAHGLNELSSLRDHTVPIAFWDGLSEMGTPPSSMPGRRP